MTAHPLFATLVPLWFAATFALSTLAISGALIERVVLALQIDLILPMATPPLGATARLLLAMGFGLIGLGMGRMVARMLEAGGRAPRAADHGVAHRRAPLRAHAELGPQGFDHPFTERAPAYAPPPAPAAEMAPRPARHVGFPPPPADGPSAAEKIAHAPLDDLNHIELIERLAIAMQNRAQAKAGQGQPTEAAKAPDGTSMALRAALANLRGVK